MCGTGCLLGGSLSIGFWSVGEVMGYKQGLAKEKRGKTRQGDLSDYMESEHYPQYRERKQEGAGTAWNWAWSSHRS